VGTRHNAVDSSRGACLPGVMVTEQPPVPGAENVVVRPSGVHGRGLFARRDIAKGERIVEYAGYKLSKAEAARRTEKQWQRGTVFIFELNSKFDVDGSPLWNKARFANHSCDPNCDSKNNGRSIWIIALRDIAKGDEISYDYNFPVEEENLVCHCGAAKCRGYVVGSEHVRHLRAWLKKQGKPIPASIQPKPRKAGMQKAGNKKAGNKKAGKTKQPRAKKAA
jgi:uncharacterized protein